MAKTVQVAAGIIQRTNAQGEVEVLAAQRGYGPMAGLWEFPGGKVEHGETPEQACERELAEELEVRVTGLRDFYTLEYDYPDFHLSMKCFLCRLSEEGGPEQDASSISSEPQANDGQLNLRWLRRKTLATLEWMPADVELIEVLASLDEAAPGEQGEQQAEAEVPSTTAKRAARAKRPARKKRARKKPDLLAGVCTADLSAGETALVRRRAAIRKSMQGNKRRDTKPELLVRQRLRAAGLTGYRLDWAKAPGRPDIAFPGRKVAIFVNGCYWHRCPHCNPSTPRKNVEFWQAKFRRNVERDQRALAELEALGWSAITIWECELKRDRLDATMERVVTQIRNAPRRVR